MFNLNDTASMVRYLLFWDTPYKTGNLAEKGAGDLGVTGDGIGWTMFGNGAKYGAILNEAPSINYTLTNQHTGKVYTGSYVNKHFKWLDNFADKIANELPILVGGIERVL